MKINASEKYKFDSKVYGNILGRIDINLDFILDEAFSRMNTWRSFLSSEFQMLFILLIHTVIVRYVVSK